MNETTLRRMPGDEVVVAGARVSREYAMVTDATVFLVDDDSHVRRLMATELELAGFHTEQFASAEEFLAEYADRGRGCILLDLRLTHMSGMELLEVLRGRHVTIPVIIVTAFGDVSAAVRSMKLGAVDFIQKPYDRDDLLAKIQRALEHDAVRRSQLDKIEAARQRLAELSEREKELLARLVAGKSSKLIAMELSISLRTVENHRSRLLAKTGAANTADLVRLSLIASLPTTVE